MTRRPLSAWMVWLILARLESENIEDTKCNILYRAVLFKNLAFLLFPREKCDLLSVTWFDGLLECERRRRSWWSFDRHCQ